MDELKHDGIKASPRFTVFTPTYNRAHTLHRVYKSLLSQTYNNFEWLVVDDGSTDSTFDLIQEWLKTADFPIVYLHQPNSGKHVAYNRAVNEARGEFFLAIDSDDGFLPNAMESMLYWWDAIPENQRDEFTGVVTLCQYEDGTVCGEPFPQSPLDTNALDLRFKFKMRAENWGFHRTQVLKEYPFPEDSSVRFVPENIVWDSIARQFKIRCINEPLRVFYQDAGNQVTKADPRKKAVVKNYFLKLINRDFDYFINDPRTFAKWATLYLRYSFHMKDWQCLNPRKFEHAGAYILSCVAVIPGMLIYLLDIAKRQSKSS